MAPALSLGLTCCAYLVTRAKSRTLTLKAFPSLLSPLCKKKKNRPKAVRTHGVVENIQGSYRLSSVR